MQLTQFTDLGLRAVMRLAVAAADETITTAALADQVAVSYTHMSKVVTRLRELGVVDARRGKGGGLSITDRGRGVSIGWLARQLEGDGEIVTCEGDHPCPLRHNCRLRGALRKAQDAFYSSLDAMTVSDVTTAPIKTVLLALH
ncbi:Rrf2 family transcriptional regulator [Hoyosella sp. YIM 151337]|uniref:RrF2 family transcriptional regulator n=1 Tax=Hoyosella sp. YIM 151337 TaxID=2992742 RepID=UPI0022365A80|nr:Rrf2 family transcriptional regulator [Hoyosella sp. YIM 151337]MCW4353971.1 Rrf2 family transcriptional regulator [Hoyosella sp. YIM 151337]